MLNGNKGHQKNNFVGSTPYHDQLEQTFKSKQSKNHFDCKLSKQEASRPNLWKVYTITTLSYVSLTYHTHTLSVILRWQHWKRFYFTQLQIWIIAPRVNFHMTKSSWNLKGMVWCNCVEWIQHNINCLNQFQRMVGWISFVCVCMNLQEFENALYTPLQRFVDQIAKVIGGKWTTICSVPSTTPTY
jgi:hypothetical protein